MTTFQEILERAEKLMKRSVRFQSWKRLSTKDHIEAASLINKFADLAERLNRYPQNLNLESISDDEMKKVYQYYEWFECLTNPRDHPDHRLE